MRDKSGSHGYVDNQLVSTYREWKERGLAVSSSE